MKKSLKFRKNKTGFTLVELVIVIAIVIILSVISVPIYRGYVDKAKYAEGYALLGSILSAQKNYYSEYGTFLHVLRSSAGSGIYTNNETVLGIDARGNKYFTWFAITYGLSEADLKTKLWTNVEKPIELRGNGCTFFRLRYSLNSGVAFDEY